jgi:hypothetical protein
LIQKCKDDLELIYKDNSNSISNNKIKKIEELKNYYFINMGLSVSELNDDNRREIIRGYNMLVDITTEKYGEVLSSNKYKNVKNYFKKFYKSKDVIQVNKKGVLWNSKKTVQEYAIKNNNTLVYLIKLKLCDFLIKNCIIFIKEKKEELEKCKEILDDRFKIINGTTTTRNQLNQKEEQLIKELEQENTCLKKLVVDLYLLEVMFKEVIKGNC